MYLLLFTCNYVVSVWRGFLFLWVLGMGYVILLWHSLGLPFNYFAALERPDLRAYGCVMFATKPILEFSEVLMNYRSINMESLVAFTSVSTLKLTRVLLGEIFIRITRILQTFLRVSNVGILSEEGIQ